MLNSSGCANKKKVIALYYMLYIICILSTTFLMLSNSYYIEKSLLEAEDRAIKLGIEDVHETVELTRLVILNPWYRVVISMTVVLSNTISLILFLASSYILLKLIYNNNLNLIRFLANITPAVNLLTLGAVVSFMIRILTLSFDNPFVISSLFGIENTDQVIYSLFSRLDLVVLGFIIYLSVILSKQQRIKLLETTLVLLSIWLIQILFSIYFSLNYFFI